MNRHDHNDEGQGNGVNAWIDGIFFLAFVAVYPHHVENENAQDKRNQQIGRMEEHDI